MKIPGAVYIAVIVLSSGLNLFSEENTETVLKLLTIPLDASSERTKAVAQIAAIKPPPVAILIQVLEKEAKGDSILATQALGEIGVPAVQPLIAALKRNEKLINAYEALRDIGTDASAAIAPLIGILRSSPAPRNRECAAEALGSILTDQSEGILALEECLKQDVSKAVIVAIENSLLNIKLRALPAPTQNSPAELANALRAALNSDNKMLLLKLHHPYCINYLSPKKLLTHLNIEFPAMKQNAVDLTIQEFKADAEITFLEEPKKVIVLNGKAEKATTFNTQRLAIGAHEGKWYIIRKDEPEE